MTDRSFCVGCGRLDICSLEPLSRHCVLQAKMKAEQPQTNADRIRTMNDEELADYHAKMQLLGEYGVDSEKTELCKKLWLDWLQSPVGGDVDEP